jgi:radical SAM protein with 4Fe4S-binding SPASM domain
VTVSIDGPREVHDRIRGRAGAYDRAMATFRALREVPRVQVFAGTTITPENEAHIPALEAALEAEVPGFRPAEWHWNWFQESEHFFGNAHLGWAGKVGSDLVRAHVARRGLPRSLVDVMELGFLVNLEAYRAGEPTGIVCQALRSSCFLSPEGDLYPCHVWDRPLGNVTEAPFAELWASPPVLEAREGARTLACGGCFTPCEAYPALAGAPVAAAVQTTRRALQLLRRRVGEGGL